MRMSCVIGSTMLVLAAGGLTSPARAQPGPQPYFGLLAGIATLSADTQSAVGNGRADVSSYKPENGPALNALGGLHLYDFVTVQGNYIWNRNDVVLTSVLASDAGLSFYEQQRRVSQHAVVADLLVYFRPRPSAIRPYLSVGTGLTRVSTTNEGTRTALNASPPPGDTRDTEILLRVAVGLDWSLGRGFAARYSFSESVSANPIGRQLAPQGQRGLANFQNLFGVVWTR